MAGRRSPKEKHRLVVEAKRLSGEQRGAFLRREGLFEADLAAWEGAALKYEVKRLERELAKKDKALREAAALLELKKKAQAIWGAGDADTDKKKES